MAKFIFLVKVMQGNEKKTVFYFWWRKFSQIEWRQFSFSDFFVLFCNL